MGSLVRLGRLRNPVAVGRAEETDYLFLTYDAQGRPSEVRNETGERVSLSYGASGLAVGMTLTDRDGVVRTTASMTRDGAGRVTHLTWGDAGSGTSWQQSTSYDAVGRRVQTTDASGNTMGFGYDAYGRLTTTTDASGATTTVVYDAAGRPLTSTNRQGETMVMTYDAAGRLASAVGPGVSRSFAYDALGRMTQAATPSHAVTQTWDGRFRVRIIPRDQGST